MTTPRRQTVPLDVATFTETATVTADAAAPGAMLPLTSPGCMSKAEAIALARACGAVVWEGRARVEKFHADDDPTRATPYEVIESDPNLLLTAGAALLWQLATGAGGTALNAAGAFCAVGDGTTAPAAGQTDLVGANKLRKAVNGAPTRAGNQAQFVSTFAAAEANFTWAEAGVANAAAGGVLLNRFLQAFGAKTAAAVWTLTITCALN